MRFNFDAYDKVYPEQTTPVASIESAVDTFKPTETESRAMDEKPGEDVMSVTPDVPPNDSAEEQPEGGNNE